MADYVSTRELALELGVTHQTLLRWFRNGDGPAHMVLPSGRLRIERGDADKWVAQMKNAERALKAVLGCK